jgi:hypothetical protein
MDVVHVSSVSSTTSSVSSDTKRELTQQAVDLVGSLSRLRDDEQPSLMTTTTGLVREFSQHIDEDPCLLRSVVPGTLLSFAGFWIRSGPKSGAASPDTGEAEKMYDLSGQVPWLGRFVSHSWRAGGKMKVASLFALYNAAAAIRAELLTSALVVALLAAGLLPAWTNSVRNDMFNVFSPGSPERIAFSGWCTVGSLTAYTSTLLWWQPVCNSLLRWRGRSGEAALLDSGVFLDKLCIHQTDLEKREKGIRSIGAYLMRSHSLLILWDPSYFTRTWCVFEVAVYRKLMQEGNIQFFPISVGALGCIVPWLFRVSLAMLALTVPLALPQAGGFTSRSL